jgi:4'-phosphopantetheinyl transferase
MSPKLLSMAMILSPDERGRADRLRFQQDRQRFIAAHAMVRTVLGGYLGRAPADLRFLSNASGKPRLEGAFCTIDLRFNLSHSHDIFLLALAEGREVGVDIERERSDLDILDIAKRFFAVEEFTALRDMPQEARRSAFFQAWTRKEAFLKAAGNGLSDVLNQPGVSPMGESSLARTTLRSSMEPFHGNVRDLSVDTGYAAALAVEGSDGTLHLWSVPNTNETTSSRN